MFKAYHTKFIKLNHQVESILNTKKSEEIINDDVNLIVNKYDLLVEELYFNYPEHLKTKVIKRFKGTNMTLPNSLCLIAELTTITPV
jgi:hypothetical protein